MRVTLIIPRSTGLGKELAILALSGTLDAVSNRQQFSANLYRLQTIARARVAGLDTVLADDLRDRCADLERGYCSSLESARDKLSSIEPSNRSLKQ